MSARFLSTGVGATDVTIGMHVETMKSGFFEPARVMRAARQAVKLTLSRFGAFVRTRAKSSIRKRKRVSAPGQPPSSHTGVLKKFIFFAYERERQNVVIGPTQANQIFGNAQGQVTRGIVPEVLEYGGALTVFEVFKWGKWRRADLRSRRRNAGLPKRKRVVRIAARPYMRPAFEIEKAKLPPLWKDSIKAA